MSVAQVKTAARTVPGARKPRGPARGPEQRGRDPERTRARILEAAIGEFARYGLGGARVDRIATRAEANKRMLYYYFGSKERLFLAVLEDAYARIRTAERDLHLLELEPVEAIERLVAFTWNYYLEHPEFITLLNSENLHRGRHLEQSIEVRATNMPLVQTLREILRRGEACGLFRPGVDPVQLYVSIAALGYFYLSNQFTLSRVFGRNLAGRRARAERLAHMQAMVVGYLSNPGAGRLAAAQQGKPRAAAIDSRSSATLG